MLSPRTATSAVAVPEEGILVVGGRTPNFVKKLVNTNQAQILQNNLKTTGEQKWIWLHLPPMLSERIKPGVAYFDGSVFVAGGNVAKHFDIEMMQISPQGISKSQWVFVSLMEYAPQYPYSLIVANERLFLMYGEGDVLEYSPSHDYKKNASGSELWQPFGKVSHVQYPTFLASNSTSFPT
ncbi:hypothetical protein ACTXT7_010882 [Hymenolepis weldensis]